MAIGAPRAGTRTRAAGAAVGVGFLWFLSLPTQRKEPARRQPHGTGEPCRARVRARSFAMLRMTRIGGSRTEQGNLAETRATARSFAVIKSGWQHLAQAVAAQAPAQNL
jgi:hypothetical protein